MKEIRYIVKTGRRRFHVRGYYVWKPIRTFYNESDALYFSQYLRIVKKKKVKITRTETVTEAVTVTE